MASTSGNLPRCPSRPVHQYLCFFKSALKSVQNTRALPPGVTIILRGTSQRGAESPGYSYQCFEIDLGYSAFSSFPTTPRLNLPHSRLPDSKALSAVEFSFQGSFMNRTTRILKFTH